MSREAFEAAAYDCLTALAGVETHDIDLRDHPHAWEAIEVFAAAAQADAFERAVEAVRHWDADSPAIDTIRALAKEAGK